MEYLQITKSMVDDEFQGLDMLCDFFGFTQQMKDDNMKFFVNGEGFNHEGFTTSLGAETGTILKEQDVLLKVGKEYVVVPTILHFLLYDTIAADRMEVALSTLYETGELSREGESIVRKGLGFEGRNYEEYLRIT